MARIWSFIYIILPWWFRQSRICLQCGRPRFDSWIGKIPWRREWVPTPVFLSREFHGQRSLAGYSPHGCKESEMTEQLTFTWKNLLEKNMVFSMSCDHIPWGQWKRINPNQETLLETLPSSNVVPSTRPWYTLNFFFRRILICEILDGK